MPLYKGKKNIGRNIKTEMAHGKPRKQAIAIAMSVAKMKKKKRKMMKKDKHMMAEKEIRRMEKKIGMMT